MNPKRLFSFLFLFLFLVSFVSAAQFDNVKDVITTHNPNAATIGNKNVNWNDLWDVYEPIKIENTFGLGKTLFEAAITDHTEQCEGNYCYSTFEAYTSGDDALIDDIIFKTQQEDNSWKTQDVRRYTLEYWGNIDEFEYQCTPTGETSVNGTEIESCENIKTGTHEGYKKLALGQVLPEGNYKVQLQAWKKPSRTVDWVIKTNGEWIDEWAVWGSEYEWTNGSLDTLHDPNSATNPNNVNDGDNDTYAERTYYASDYPSSVSLATCVGRTFTETTIREVFYKGASGGNPLGANTLSASYYLQSYNGATWSTEDTNNVAASSISGSSYYTLNKAVSGLRVCSSVSYSIGTGDLHGASVWNRLYALDYEKATGYSTVTLNSPADSSITDTANIEFNATATVTGGATLVNMSLWNNDGGWSLKNSTIPEILVNESNLISYYKLNEELTSGSPIIDETGNYSLTAFGLNNATGILETAYKFEADNLTDRIESGHIDPDNYNSGLSYTAWFKAESFVGTEMDILNVPETGSWGSIRMTIKSDGSLRMRFGCGVSSCEHDNLNASSVSLNQWYMITMTHDTSFDKIYLNGTLMATFSSGTLSNNAATLAIGNDAGSGSPGPTFDGIIDEVGVFGRALTAEDITNLYNSGVGLRPGDSVQSSTQTWNYTIPAGNTIWNVQACDSDGDCGFATSNYTVSLDSAAPTIDITYPTAIFDALAQDQNISLNYTITDTNIDSCWYEYNGTNTTTPCDANSSFLYELDENLLTLWANDTIGNTNSSSASWGVKIRENSQTFSNSTVEGAIENFYANVTIDESIEISSATMIYNGTEVSGTFTSDGQERYLAAESYTIPDFPADANATFYWEVTLTDDTQINLSTQTQLVQSVGLDNCSTYTNQLFNISLFNEETLAPLNGTIELFYKVQNKPDYDTIETLSTKLEGVSNTLVCSGINLSTSGLAYSVEMRYSATGYASELYHIQNADINGVEPVLLYDLSSNDSTEFKVTYQDDSFNFVEGAIIQLQRRYISEDLYRVVEAPITSNEGVAVLHVDLDSIKYKATVIKNGEILDTFDNLVFKCQSELSGECEQKLLGEIDPQNIIDYDTERDFTYSVSPGDNNVTISYSVPSSSPSTVNLVLTQKDQFGNTTQCNKTIVSSAGSIQCSFDDSLDISYLELALTKDGVPIAYNTYVIDENTGMDFFDNNYIIVVVLILSLVGMAITSPEWIVINAVFSLLLSGMLWLVNGVSFVAGLGILMYLVIAAGLLILKLAKQEDK